MDNKEYIEGLINDYLKSKTIKGDFKVDPKNILHHYTDLEIFDEDCAGIYFLMEDNYITYIGMSKISIKDRIYGGGWSGGHIFDKVFSDFRFIDLSHLGECEIKTIERCYINIFNPPQNTTDNNKLYCEHLTEDYLKSIELGKRRYEYFKKEQSKFAANQLKEYWESCKEQ